MAVADVARPLPVDVDFVYLSCLICLLISLNMLLFIIHLCCFSCFFSICTFSVDFFILIKLHFFFFAPLPVDVGPDLVRHGRDAELPVVQPFIIVIVIIMIIITISSSNSSMISVIVIMTVIIIIITIIVGIIIAIIIIIVIIIQPGRRGRVASAAPQEGNERLVQQPRKFLLRFLV